nr:DUF2335 domain-containing protein [Rhodococcus sp. WWJCD1]
MTHDDHSGSPETSEGARGRHYVDSASVAADEPATPGDVSAGNGEEGYDTSEVGESSTEVDSPPSSLDASSTDAAASVDEVEEILEGVLEDSPGPTGVRRQRWKGPLPPPAALAEYEKVLPGSANRVLSMAERSMDLQEGRQQTVRVAIDGEVEVQKTIAYADRDSLKRGQWLAAGVSVLVSLLTFAGLFLTPWAAVGFAVPLAQIATSIVRTVSDGHRDNSESDRPANEE